VVYTSGDDRIFPKGMPVGQVTAARPGNPFQDISLDPAGLAGGLEEVLIILEGVHQEIPELKTASEPVYLAPLPPTGAGDAQPASDQAASTGESNKAPALATDADKLREHYKDVSDAQGHKFGDNPVGSKAVNFNLPVKPDEKPPAAKSQAPSATGAAVPKPAPQAKPPAATPSQPKAPAAAKPDDQ
jgi:rod shape-determining protein MreC